MGFWAGIKHAINSSLGTKDFKPLDKIIRDSYYVYASDDVLKVAYNEKPLYHNVDLTTAGIMGVYGTINFHFEVEGNLTGNSQLTIYIGDGEDVKTIERTLDYEIVDILVEVKKGDKIQFSAHFGDYSKVDNLYITINGKIGSAPDTGIFIE